MDYRQFVTALHRLEEMLSAYFSQEEYPTLILEALEDSLVKRFEYSMEMAWKSCKRHLAQEGFAEAATGSPRSILRLAGEMRLIDSTERWMTYLSARQNTAHDYSGEKAHRVLAAAAYFYRDGVHLYEKMTGEKWESAALIRIPDMSLHQRIMVGNLLHRHVPHSTVWIYGSRAKGCAHATSDLDMVLFAPPQQHSALDELEEAFEKSDLPFRVDLFTWDHIPEEFRKTLCADHLLMQHGR